MYKLTGRMTCTDHQGEDSQCRSRPLMVSAFPQGSTAQPEAGLIAGECSGGVGASPASAAVGHPPRAPTRLRDLPSPVYKFGAPGP